MPIAPWLHAFRLRTLPLAASSIITGSALAAFFQDFRWPVFALALLTALLLQVLSNLANDLGDHEHGTDNEARVGPRRAVQSGAISATAMKRAMVACAVLAVAAGITLVAMALGPGTEALLFVLLGLLAVAAAVKYTFGSSPYGYAGLGDASVLLFFGLVGVLGTCWLHGRSFEALAVLPALGIGLLATAVLNLNNMRDLVNDAASGKRTLAVRLGPARAKRYHAVLVAGGFSCLLLFTLLRQRDPWQYVFVPAAFLLLRHLRAVGAAAGHDELDLQMKPLALTTLLTALLFSLGLIAG